MIVYKVNSNCETRDKYFFDSDIAFAYAEYLETSVERVTILDYEHLPHFFKKYLKDNGSIK